MRNDNNNNVNWGKWKDFRINNYKLSDIEYNLENMQFTPDDIEILREIVESKFSQNINGVTIDIFTAESILSVYDVLNEANKQHVHKLSMNETIKLVKTLYKEVE